MTRPDRMARMIPWYVNGSLAADEREQLERYVESNGECRDLLTHATICASVEDPSTLDDHIHAQLLVEHAEGHPSIDPSVARRIDEHLRSCAVCRESYEIVRDMPATISNPGEGPLRMIRTEPAEPARPRGIWASIWDTLSATVLRPAPALAYLLVLGLLAVPAFQVITSPFDGASPIAVIEGAPFGVNVPSELRGADGDAEAIALPAGDGPLWVELRSEIDDWLRQEPTATIRIELGDDRQHQTLAASQVGADGTISVLLDRRALAAGEPIELRLRYDKPGHAMHDRVIGRTLLRLER